MTYVECLKLLGLPRSATPMQIKCAYRRLAQQTHPDKHGGDEVARQHFITIGDAYHTLMQCAQSVKGGNPVGLCVGCGNFGEVSMGLDGNSRCWRCALMHLGGRLLPLPSVVVVKGTGCLVFLAAAIHLLVLAVSTGDLVYSAAACFAGLLSLVALAYTCITVGYCANKRDWAAVIRLPNTRKWRFRAVGTIPSKHLDLPRHRPDTVKEVVFR